MRRLLVVALLLGLIEPLTAQDTSILATNRKVDWSTAGATIVTRTTQCGGTIAAYTGGPGTINTAIANCASGQVVQLGAGTFSLNGSIDILRSDVTLRGMGPNLTKINFTGNSFGCGGLFPDVCVSSSSPDYIGSPQNTATWTAGYSKGTTVVTLGCGGNCASMNLQVGSILHLDQLDDSNTDPGTLWNCSATLLSSNVGCAGEGGQEGRSGRNQTENPTVTAINGNQVTISPGLNMPNWRSGQTPGAWWMTGLPLTNVGIEAIAFDSSANGMDAQSSRGTIVIRSTRQSWVTNVRATKGKRAMVLLYHTNHITVRDSYLHSSRSLADQAYGIETFGADYTLFENNIIQDIVAGVIPVGFGQVFAYNFCTDSTYNPSGAPFPPGNSQMMAGNWHHDGGTAYTLYEGNDCLGMKQDGIHGTNNFVTAFRNYYSGFETGKSCHTVGVMIYSFNRFNNVIGNVLGTSGYHTSYDVDQTGCSGKQIYALGVTIAGAFCGGCFSPSDGLVASTLMRWGNYDTVTAGTGRFVSGEVPSGLSDYPNPVPPNQTLPASFYRASSAPGWWTTPWGSPSYPAIGPDVTGGSIAGLNGHAQKIPARLCYENKSHTTTGSTTGTIPLIADFNAADCYATGGTPDTTAPVVTITTNGGTNFTVTTTPLTLDGGAVDDILVVYDCRWTNGASGGAGVAPGAFTWTAPSIALAVGANLLTVFCHDAANNEGNDTITVTLSPPPPPGPFFRIRR
ncbi:MAG TPA: hypothetical protein VK467_04180 [Gemmatimonadales bacterium]|nr:hypothetical protein [Gemmatimonadales bacterium]